MSDVLEQLSAVLTQRKQAAAKDSYVASLHASGLNKILEKLGEECTETIIAAKDFGPADARTDLIKETADLWFHTMVMLSHLDVNIDEVLAELERRFGLSGLEEKASRTKSSG